MNLQQNASADHRRWRDGTGYGLVYLAVVGAWPGHRQPGHHPHLAGCHRRVVADERDAGRVEPRAGGQGHPRHTADHPQPGAPVTLTSGVRNAIVLNLAVRLRRWVGAEVSKTLLDRATMALGLVQANNQHRHHRCRRPARDRHRGAVPGAAHGSRITDTQSVSDGSKDVADAFSLLVMMMGQWQRRRWLIWNEEELALVVRRRLLHNRTGEDFDARDPTNPPPPLCGCWLSVERPGSGSGELAPTELLPFPLSPFGSSSTTEHPIATRWTSRSPSSRRARTTGTGIAIKDLKSHPRQLCSTIARSR